MRKGWRTTISCVFVCVVFLFAVVAQYTRAATFDPVIQWKHTQFIDSYPSGADITITNEGNSVIESGMTTPVRVSGLAEGTYQLTLKRQGFVEVSRRVSVSGKKMIVGGGSSHYDALRESYVIPLKAELQIDSYPVGGRVYIDGMDMAHDTPFTLLVETGDHRIEIKKDGFEPLGNCTVDLALPINEQKGIDDQLWDLILVSRKKQISYRLKATFFKVCSFGSSPEGADVFIDGAQQPAGKTPLHDLRLSAGRHIVRFERAGYAPVTRDLVVDETLTETVHVSFGKLVRFTAYRSGVPGADINARVTIAGTSIKNRLTPFETALPRGTITAVFTREPMYVPVKKRIDISKSGAVTAVMKLKRSPVTLTIEEKRLHTPIAKAHISIDGRARGTSNTHGQWEGTIPAGRHTVSIDTNGRYPRHKEKIRVEGAFREQYTISVTPFTDGKLVVDTRPHFPGAKIYLDGELIGHTVRSISRVTRTYHEVSVRHRDLDGAVTISIVLEKKNGSYLN